MEYDGEKTVFFVPYSTDFGTVDPSNFFLLLRAEVYYVLLSPKKLKYLLASHLIKI